ncbi:hypothetical protein niasHT_011214 [Heterodera trifolii]|uniref:Uncharacterized protein n=1 Tax=Heterodera trifolii TaxID=157864 RepID=A0ABD2L0Q3_9BILA
MPKLAIFCYSKSDCAALTELFNSHMKVNSIDPLFNNSLRGNTEHLMTNLDKIMMEIDNANWTVFTVQIGQLNKLKLSPEQLMRKYSIDKALIIWHQNKKILPRNGNSSVVDSNLTIIPQKKIIHSGDYQQDQWNKFFQCWPIEVWPIFVQYEKLHIEEQTDNNDLSARVLALAELIGMDTKHCNKIIQNDKKYVNPFNTVCCPTYGTPPALFRQSLQLRSKLPQRLAYFFPEPEPHIYAQNSLIIRVVEPYIPPGAIQNVNDALMSKQISSAGTWPKQLAAKLCAIYGFPVAVPCCNGFTSLVLVLRSANIGPGADVLMPSLTFVAVSNAVLNVGANPVFVDSADEWDYNPSWSLLLRAATQKTRAVIVTHSYGCPAGDIELIAAGCKKHGWILIEDISECVGITTLTSVGEEKLLGTFGDYICASLNSNKFIHFESAINGKINGLGAAMACGVLDKLSDIIGHRRVLSTWYRVGMAQLFAKRLLVQMPRCGPRDTPWLFCLLCRSSAERTALRAHLAMNGIETRNMFFPLHLQPMFDAAHVDLDLPMAQLFGSTGFALPTHPGLDKQQIDQIVITIYQFFNETMD